MQRWKITIEYDGQPFHGWQRQDNAPSVQQALEDAAEKLCGKKTYIQGAGRTDSGVHALGQAAHLDMEKPFTPNQICSGLNFHLSKTSISPSGKQAVYVTQAKAVSKDFHARFHAVKRTYLYRIFNRRVFCPLYTGFMWHVPYPLNIDLMQKGADFLIGFHDFSSFRAAGCQALSPEKTLSRLSITQEKSLIDIKVEAPSFLYHQVRNIVGTLQQAGSGKYPPEIIKDILEARDRTKAGPTAPPDGLYLTNVFYDRDKKKEEHQNNVESF